MTTHDKELLLNDILGGEDLNRLREATLTRGLDALRSRAQRRRKFQAAGIIAALLVLGWRWHFRPTIPATSGVRPTLVSAPVAPLESDKVKFISQKELFALFPNRPIALIGEPGHQGFLLLDELPKVPQRQNPAKL